MGAAGTRLLAVPGSGCSAPAPSPHVWEGRCLLAALSPPGRLGQPGCLSPPPAPPGAGDAQGRVKLCRPTSLGSNCPCWEQRWVSPQGAGRGGPRQSVSVLVSILSGMRALPRYPRRGARPSLRVSWTSEPVQRSRRQKSKGRCLVR